MSSATRTELACLKSAVMNLAGSTASLDHYSERPWASPTFSGARHSLGISFKGKGACGQANVFIAGFPNHEFDLEGQIVADAAIVNAEYKATPDPRFDVQVELLSLNDRGQS